MLARVLRSTELRNKTWTFICKNQYAVSEPAATCRNSEDERITMLQRLLALLLLAIATPAIAQTWFWKDSHGKAIPDTPSQKTVNGVGAWLLVTSDEDWEAKWNTPSETIPAFTQASTVTLGKHVFILAFVANPTRSNQGDVNVTCDFEIERPNHVVTHRSDIECLRGKPLGSERTLYLTKQIVGFVGEKDDPLGKWIVRITIKDLNRPVSIPLETSFTLL
jgi:hypothetical protein